LIINTLAANYFDSSLLKINRLQAACKLEKGALSRNKLEDMALGYAIAMAGQNA